MTLFRDKNKKAEHLTCWQQDSYCLFKIQTTIQMWENVKYLVVTSKSAQDLQCQVKQIHSNTLCYNLMLDTKGKLAMFSFLMCPHNVSEHWCLFFSWFQWGQSVCGSMWPPREKALHPAPFSKSTAFFVHLQLKISQLFQKKKDGSLLLLFIRQRIVYQTRTCPPSNQENGEVLFWLSVFFFSHCTGASTKRSWDTAITFLPKETFCGLRCESDITSLAWLVLGYVGVCCFWDAENIN